MLRGGQNYNREASLGYRKTKMSTIQKQKIEIRQDLLKRYLVRLEGPQAVAFQQAVEAANELVNAIESRIQTTQGFYGDYLSHATSLVNVAVFMCAGADRQGLQSAAQINGLV